VRPHCSVSTQRTATSLQVLLLYSLYNNILRVKITLHSTITLQVFREVTCGKSITFNQHKNYYMRALCIRWPNKCSAGRSLPNPGQDRVSPKAKATTGDFWSPWKFSETYLAVRYNIKLQPSPPRKYQLVGCLLVHQWRKNCWCSFNNLVAGRSAVISQNPYLTKITTFKMANNKNGILRFVSPPAIQCLRARPTFVSTDLTSFPTSLMYRVTCTGNRSEGKVKRIRRKKQKRRKRKNKR